MRAPSELVPASRFVVRTPLLPFDEFVAWGADVQDASDEACARVRERLRRVLERPAVREALFLSSPSLMEGLGSWLSHPDSENGQKVERALVRYFARMTGRATPFGLFSGLSVGRLGPRTVLETVGQEAYARNTRLDNDYLFALTTELRRDPAIRRALRWRPNSSAYEFAGRLRYAEARLHGKQRSYHLVAVDAGEFVQLALRRAERGATIEELVQTLRAADPELDAADVEAFVGELIDHQLLVSELAPAMTGAEPLQHVLTCLRAAAPEAEATARLDEAARALAAADARGIGNPAELYLGIAEALRPLPTEVDLARMFQVDLVKPAPSAELGPGVVAEVERGIQLLRRLLPPQETESLQQFMRAFSERYEDREVPLLDALDEESGIGFETSGAPAAVGAPLLAQLQFPGAQESDKTRWGRLETFLLRKLQGVWARGAHEFVLTEAELKPLLREEPSPLTDALSVMATVAARSSEAAARGEFEVLFGGASGPSGAQLLGRFCHASPEVHALVASHLRAEEALQPGAVFAEVVHLSEGRIGNILCRPVLREYEIPFLGISGAPDDKQLPVQDLLVSVRGGRIVLRSRRLGREVIPRLSTAHNFRLLSMAVYRFLCALQEQEGTQLQWSFGALDGARFLPRVRYGKLVLARARWRLDEQDLEPLAQAVREARRARKPEDIRLHRGHVYAAMQAVRRDLGLPRHVLVADGDNELPVDLDNPLSVDSAAWLLYQRKTALLREFYPEPERLLATAPEGRFTHQLVLCFTRKGEPARPEALTPTAVYPRRFAPGSEWLYARLYTGPSTADEVLRRVVAPVRAHALASGAAARWFFLRYRDTADHLRVRFRGDPRRLRDEVLPALHEAAAPLLADGSLWRMELGTYEREVERYGGPHGIELAEELFFHDSEAVLAIVEQLQGDSGADARWRLALRGAHLLLEDLGLDAAARSAVALRARDAFRREFRSGLPMYEQISARYRVERNALFALLSREPAPGLAPGFAALDRRSQRLRPVVAELTARERSGLLSPGIQGMAWSHVHMHLNRMLHASQRAQELVLSDLLSRCYASLEARQGKPEPGP